jgi:hypothetical protein
MFDGELSFCSGNMLSRFARIVDCADFVVSNTLNHIKGDFCALSGSGACNNCGALREPRLTD